MSAETRELFDYVACFYPEGNISEEYTFLFNQEHIAEILFEGYSNEEDEKFVNEILNVE